MSFKPRISHPYVVFYGSCSYMYLHVFCKLQNVLCNTTATTVSYLPPNLTFFPPRHNPICLFYNHPQPSSTLDLTTPHLYPRQRHRPPPQVSHSEIILSPPPILPRNPRQTQTTRCLSCLACLVCQSGLFFTSRHVKLVADQTRIPQLFTKRSLSAYEIRTDAGHGEPPANEQICTTYLLEESKDCI